MIYYPAHLKFTEVEVDLHDSRPPHHIKTPAKSDEWRLAVTLSWVVFIHVCVCLVYSFSLVDLDRCSVLITFVSFLIVGTTTPDADGHIRQVELWATFLGVSSALLSGMQYIPQLLYTWRMKLVGALSIRTMLMQSPGSVIMVISIAIRWGSPLFK